jgi:hypothetical protein
VTLKKNIKMNKTVALGANVASDFVWLDAICSWFTLQQNMGSLPDINITSLGLLPGSLIKTQGRTSECCEVICKLILSHLCKLLWNRVLGFYWNSGALEKQSPLL